MKYLILIIFFFPFFTNAFTNQAILDEVNEVRDKAGVEDLILEEELNMIALAKALDLVINDYWAHSNNGNPWTFFQRANYNFSAAGEVLARSFGVPSKKRIVKAWVNSPTHEAVLIDPVYTKAGVATVASVTVMIFVKDPVSPPWVVPIKNNAL